MADSSAASPRSSSNFIDDAFPTVPLVPVKRETVRWNRGATQQTAILKDRDFVKHELYIWVVEPKIGCFFFPKWMVYNGKPY